MDPITAVIAIVFLLVMPAAALHDSIKRGRRFQSETDGREFVSFRGQHFKYLKREAITQIIKKTTRAGSWRREASDFIPEPSKKDCVLEQIIRIPKKPHCSKLYLRYSLEKYGKFSQTLYEWTGDPEAINNARSEECRVVQEIVNAVERSLGEAELRKSRSEFKLGGTRTYTGLAFSPEMVRYVLTNAVAAIDDDGRTIPFRVSLEGRKNQWLSLVEAYIIIENSREIFLRFYSLDESAEGLSAWELRCDWRGTFDAMLDSNSAEWKVVRSLFKEVQLRLAKAGAITCFPPSSCGQGLNMGLYQSWDHEVVERIVHKVAESLASPMERLPFSGCYMRAERPKRKGIPGAILLEIYQYGVNSDGFYYRQRRLGDLCIQFIPYAPIGGEVSFAGNVADEADAPVFREAIEVIEWRMTLGLKRIGAQRINYPRAMRIQFLEEIHQKAPVQTRDTWPTPQDYNEAVQSLAINFVDPDLKSGSVETNALGLPRSASGAFASVYKVSCNQKNWALRCFNSPVRDQLLRYEKASKFICADDLPYTVWCEYVERGVHLQDKWYPLVKMEWVEGTPLCQFIEGILHDQEALVLLREKFAKMMHDLQVNNVAHGDLQHGNIIIRNGDFVLVDYDCFFVPELAGLPSWENGHRNYQHPHRNSRHFGPYLDNFSAWVIDSSLLILVHEPGFWSRFGAGEENMLFFATDFMNPDDSELFQILLNHKNAELSQRALFLQSLLLLDVEKLPALNN